MTRIRRNAGSIPKGLYHSAQTSEVFRQPFFYVLFTGLTGRDFLNPQGIQIIQPRHLRYSVKRFLILLFTGFEGLDRLSREEFVALFLEHGQVARFIIGLAVLPHSPDDALPFIGQFADRFVMVHFLSEFLITEACPSRKFDGGIGKFMPA